MGFCGLELTPAETAALGGVALTIASELIGASSLKENSIVQLGLTLVRRFLPSSSHTPVRSATRRKASPESQVRTETTRQRSPKSSSRTSKQGFKRTSVKVIPRDSQLVIKHDVKVSHGLRHQEVLLKR